MKQGMLLGLAIILAVGASGASDNPQDDLPRMAGTWESHLLEAGGQAIPPQERDGFKMKLVIRGSTYAFLMEEKQFIAGKLVLDPSKKPRTIDAIPNEGPHRGKLQPGIYQFDGEDMMFVFAEPGQRRPTEFRTRAGTTEMLILYKRVAK